MGKSLQEGYGEVQEMIDICDFAVGLSRQLYGLSMHSERPATGCMKQWHPIGVVGIISASISLWPSVLEHQLAESAEYPVQEPLKRPRSAPWACQIFVAERLCNGVPGPDGHREIEGGNNTYHPDGMPLLIHPVAGPFTVHGKPV